VRLEPQVDPELEQLFDPEASASPATEVIRAASPIERDWYAELRPKLESDDPIDSATGLAVGHGNGSEAESKPVAAQSCSRCHQPSTRPVCDTCAEALDLLRALSGWQ
jgi:hypothetical protein